MKYLYVILAALAALTLYKSGELMGYYGAVRDQDQRKAECHIETEVVAESEICRYYGYDEKCRVKPRLGYAYISHKFYACLYGKKGKAWAR